MDSRLPIRALACALVLLACAVSASAQEPGAQQAAPLDSDPPVLVLGAKRSQPLAPVLEAFATCSERCEFETAARVEGVPRLDRLRVVTPAKASEGGTRMRFELRVSPRAHKLMTAALRGGNRVQVRVTVVAFDLAENSTERSRVIRVRPPGPVRRPPPPLEPVRRS